MNVRNLPGSFAGNAITLLAVIALATPALARQRLAQDTSASIVRVGPWASSTTELRSAWPTYGNGPSHTGYYPDEIATGTFEPGWTAELDRNIQQVAVGDGRVYLVPLQYFGEARLTALDEKQGSPLWTYEFAECFSLNPPTYDQGHVYVQRGNHYSDTQLWSIHADTGIPFWIAPHAAQWEQYLAPTVADGKVWVNGGSYGGMYGFRQSDGVQLFFEYLEQYDAWTPSWYAGSLHSWVQGHFRRHDPDDGHTLWSIDMGWDWSGYDMNRTSAIANERAFVVGNPDLHAIDLTTRELAWSVSGSFHGTPAVANGVVYVLADSFVNAYDAWSGEYLGVYPGASGLVDQPLVTDDLVIFSSLSTTYVYRRATYQLLTTLPAGGHLSLANDRLFVATSAGLRTYQVGAAARHKANLTADWHAWTSGPARARSELVLANCGAGPTRPFLLAFFLSSDTRLDSGDTLLRLDTLPPLAVGETRTATVELARNPLIAGKYLLALPDAGNGVEESNENNLVPSGVVP